jgi:hypothetical protein
LITVHFQVVAYFVLLIVGFKVTRHSLCTAWNLSLLLVKHVLTVGVISLCGITSAMSQQVSTWEYIGNPLGDSLVIGITVDPMNDSVYYVSSYNGLYVTRDRGNRWTRHLSGYTPGFAIDPLNPTRLFCSSTTKLYRSEDRGYSWQYLRDFPKYVQSVLVSARDSAVYVGIRWENSPGANGIFKSTDHGQTWAFLSYGVTAQGLIPWDIEEDQGTGMLYVGTEIYDHPTPYRPPFLRSSNGGVTWIDMSSMFSWHVIRIQADEIAHRVYALTENAGLYRSTDNGTSWRYLNNYFWLELLLDRRHPNLLFGGTHTYASSGGGVFFSKDSGLTFSRVGLLGKIVGSLALDGTSTELYAACYSSGIYRARLFLTDVHPENGQVQAYDLAQNFPNPFNPSTTIRYGLPHKSQVSLMVYNTLGQQVALLVQGEQEAGSHEVRFEASGLSSGVYLYRLRAGDFVQTRKLLLIR